MLFRIDIEHFLTHMIDHFTREEIINMEYAIISSKVKNNGRSQNMKKFSTIYPSYEITESYRSNSDKTLLKKEYKSELKENETVLYNVFINNILMHKNIVILSVREENPYIDILTEFLMDKYGIDCIDLNQLFIKGRVGPYYIDRDKIHNKAVDVRKLAIKTEKESLSASKEGRAKLLSLMKKNEKIKKLKNLGFDISRQDHENLDKMLVESWVEDI